VLVFQEHLAGIFGEPCVVFVKPYQCSLTKKCRIKQIVLVYNLQ